MNTTKSKIKFGEVDLDDSYLDAKNHKVRITTFLDGDILDWLKIEAAVQKIGYQTLLNQVLRRTMSLREPAVQEQIWQEMTRRLAELETNLTKEFEQRISKLEKKRA